MLIFGYVICGIATIIAIPILSFSLYMSLITLGSLIPRRIKNRAACSAKIAILIPAQNEELTIEKSVTALIADIDYPPELYEPIVIADNCTDSTSYLASFSGARVLERTNEWKRGKYHAVEWAIKQLKKEKFDLFIILNSGSYLKRDSLRKLDAEFAEGHIAMQLTEESTTNKNSWIRALKTGLEAHLYYMQPRGRDRIGFSSPITGNGTCLTKHILEQIPFAVSEHGDIIEYFFQLISKGEKIRFICDKESGVLTSSDSIQSSHKISKESLKVMVPNLFKESVRGNFTALESLVNIFLPPPGTMIVSLLVLIFTGGMLCLGADLPSCEVLVKFGLAIILVALFGTISLHIYILTGMVQHKSPLKTWVATLLWPVIVTGHLLLGNRESTP